MLHADLTGLYHVGARDKCSKFEFARTIARIFGKNEDVVYESRSDEVSFKAQRPRDTSLDVTQVTKVLGVSMPSVIEGTNGFKKFMDEGFVERLRLSRIPGEV